MTATSPAHVSPVKPQHSQSNTVSCILTSTSKRQEVNEFRTTMSVPTTRTGIAASKKSVTGTLFSALGYRSDRHARVDCKSWRLLMHASHETCMLSRSTGITRTHLCHTFPTTDFGTAPGSASSGNTVQGKVLQLKLCEPKLAWPPHEALLCSGHGEGSQRTIGFRQGCRGLASHSMALKP